MLARASTAASRPAHPHPELLQAPEHVLRRAQALPGITPGARAPRAPAGDGARTPARAGSPGITPGARAPRAPAGDGARTPARAGSPGDTAPAPAPARL